MSTSLWSTRISPKSFGREGSRGQVVVARVDGRAAGKEPVVAAGRVDEERIDGGGRRAHLVAVGAVAQTGHFRAVADQAVGSGKLAVGIGARDRFIRGHDRVGQRHGCRLAVDAAGDVARRVAGNGDVGQEHGRIVAVDAAPVVGFVVDDGRVGQIHRARRHADSASLHTCRVSGDDRVSDGGRAGIVVDSPGIGEGFVLGDGRVIDSQRARIAQAASEAVDVVVGNCGTDNRGRSIPVAETASLGSGIAGKSGVQDAEDSRVVNPTAVLAVVVGNATVLDAQCAAFIADASAASGGVAAGNSQAAQGNGYRRVDVDHAALPCAVVVGIGIDSQVGGAGPGDRDVRID